MCIRDRYYQDDLKVECPTGSENYRNLQDVSLDLSRRLTSLFQANKEGQRPIHQLHPIYQNDPHFKDLILFYEYFHGDNGRGVGATHQTGWTGVVAELIDKAF